MNSVSKRQRRMRASRRLRSSSACWPGCRAMTCRASRPVSRSCSTSTPSTRSPLQCAAGARARDDQGSRRIHQSLPEGHRIQSRTLHQADRAAQSRRRNPRFPAGSARLHRRRADRHRGRAIFGSEIPCRSRRSSTASGPRRTFRRRRSLDHQGHRCAQLVLFSASERWHEDGKEHEHYSDSGGKSGGQKEKLAYTVLAASLAYQFGLESGATRSRSFRFVVIDEAFGRGF